MRCNSARQPPGLPVHAGMRTRQPANCGSQGYLSVRQSALEPSSKRKALEAAYPGIVTSDLPEWNQDSGLLDWLTSL